MGIDILIIATDPTNHPDQQAAQRCCYWRGDIFQVWPEGRCVIPTAASRMLLLRCSGIEYDELKLERLDTRGVTRRRRASVDISALPVAVRNALNTQRWSTVTRNALRGAIVIREIEAVDEET